MTIQVHIVLTQEDDGQWSATVGREGHDAPTVYYTPHATLPILTHRIGDDIAKAVAR